MIGTYNHAAMESNVTVEWVNVCSGSTQILTVYFYINDIDVIGAVRAGNHYENRDILVISYLLNCLVVR